MSTAAAAPERMEFKTELKQLLDLIIHSLYTKKEIFLRELISNSADAIDKIRFEALKTPDLLAGDADFKIRVVPDKAAGTLTLSDNGIGMSRDTIVENLGTIAKSGTRQFLENLKTANVQNRPELIGQFGVGFYASFMAAERVTVVSRAAGSEDAVKWESDGQGAFTVDTAERASRGTDVVLHLREDSKEFLDGWRLREIIKRYSDFIDYPILLTTETEKDGKTEAQDEEVNSRQAIWLRPKSEVKEEEYNAFYKQHTRDFEDPLKTIAIAAEGTIEFRALLYFPAHRPVDILSGPEKKSGLDLYVRRVLIMHEAEELSPPWMRFVKGVVDAADLPLNVSRETLQHHPLLARIKSNLANRVIKTMEEIKTSEYQTYVKFFNEFGAYVKEGAATDYANRDRLSDLLLVESTKTKAGEFTNLGEYVSRMPQDQKEIFYLIGESRDMIENSPYVEHFKEKGWEVLLLTDPVDEYLVSSLRTFKDKSLKAADRKETEADKSDEQKKLDETFKPLLDALKPRLDVAEVRLSSRLKESAAVLVADEYAMSAHMERLMRRMGRGDDLPESKRTLELNPNHPAVKALLKVAEQNPADSRLENLGMLLYDQALIAEGSRVKDPSAFARRMNELITLQLGG